MKRLERLFAISDIYGESRTTSDECGRAQHREIADPRIVARGVDVLSVYHTFFAAALAVSEAGWGSRACR